MYSYQNINEYEARLEAAAQDCMRYQTNLEAAAYDCMSLQTDVMTLQKQAAESDRRLSEGRQREVALQTQVKKLQRDASQVNADCVWRAELLSKLERHAVEAKKEKQAKADYEVNRRRTADMWCTKG